MPPYLVAQQKLVYPLLSRAQVKYLADGTHDLATTNPNHREDYHQKRHEYLGVALSVLAVIAHHLEE